MNPLSPFAYILRRRSRTLLLSALIALAVMGIYLLIGLFQQSYIAPEYTINRYLSKFSLVQSQSGETVDTAVAAQIRTHPDVLQAVPQKNVEIVVPNVGGLGFYFRLFGLRESDAGLVLDQSGVTLVDGRLPQPGGNGVALSREIAAALDLEIGDTFDRTADKNEFLARYASIVSPLELVGILSGDVRLGIMSYEYLDNQEAYRNVARSGLLIFPQPERAVAVDNFLEQSLDDASNELHTFTRLEKATAQAQAALIGLFIPGMLLVTVAITLVVGAINQLAFMQRLPEFGTLHAVGHSKRWLARRLTWETAVLALAGWVLGILGSLAGMAVLSTAVYGPRGFPFSPFQVSGFLLAAPVPAAVVGFTLFTALRTLRRMDAVAIVERGQLGPDKPQMGHAQPHHSPRPLAATTFYRRHSRRAATLIGAMALMIVGTALLVFIFDAVMDGGQPALNNLSRTSRVSPLGPPLTAVETTQFGTHPTVARAIPATIISPLTLVMPLIRDNFPLETYAVSADDMAYLIDLYNLELAEGDLPHPAGNEVVIPWTAAKNRDLQVGDVIGDPEHPIYPDAPTLPAPLVISGIFAPATNPADEVWLGFLSQAFIDENPDLWRSPRSLILVPRTGQKEVLDTWLENEVADEQRIVVTYRKMQASIREATNMGLFAISLMESILALVAALALAGLNYIFITQRNAEFGVLHALGFSRRHLVWRVTRETFFVTGIAWLLGVLGCAVVLAYLHHNLYAPGGFRLNFFNLTPWLYTLPVPAAVLLVSAGAVSRALSRLDPVSVIERR